MGSSSTSGAAGTGGDGGGGAADRSLLGYLLLARVLHLLQMKGSWGIFFSLKKTRKRQTVEKTFIECNKKPSDQRPAVGAGCWIHLGKAETPSALISR